MDGNRISGEIPPELGNLTELRVLGLDSNQLTGEIPDELGRLGHLLTLNLSNNHLKGEIPPNLSNLSELTILDLSANDLSGVIPKEIGDFEALEALNLSHNNLSGEIPSQLGNLVSLRYFLDLSSNSLSGEIPSNLNKLAFLEILNLSRNHLSGMIPSFSDMISLSSFDFSYNNLTGPIPTGIAFRNASANSFLGNSGLCGSVAGLNPCNSPPTGNSGKKRKKVLIGVLVPIGALVIFAIAVASIFILRRKSKLLDEEGKNSGRFDSYESMIWERESRFTFREIVRVTNDFDDKFCIGQGGFGSVYKAVLSSGATVAVKRLNMTDSSDIPMLNRQSFQNEIKTLTEVRHRNIIKLYGFCSRSSCMYLVYEYVERGSLAKVLYALDKDTELNWETRIKIVQGLAHALSYLHHDCKPSIVHRDVTLNNILIEWDFEPRLSDFGTAKLLSPDSSNWTSVAGSYGYMAPGMFYILMHLSSR